MTSIPENIPQKIIKQWVFEHLETNRVIIRIQHGFVKNKSHHTNLIAFFDDVTRLVDQKNAVDIVYLVFRN